MEHHLAKYGGVPDFIEGAAAAMGNSIEMWVKRYAPQRRQRLIAEAVDKMAQDSSQAHKTPTSVGLIDEGLQEEWQGTEFDESEEFVSDVSDPSVESGDGGVMDSDEDGREEEAEEVGDGCRDDDNHSDGGGGSSGIGGGGDGGQGEVVVEEEEMFPCVGGGDEAACGKGGDEDGLVGVKKACKLQLRMLMKQSSKGRKKANKHSKARGV